MILPKSLPGSNPLKTKVLSFMVTSISDGKVSAGSVFLRNVVVADRVLESHVDGRSALEL